jgi:uncharacterized protein YdeI (YjbR/CyaY-like superfamily)
MLVVCVPGQFYDGPMAAIADRPLLAFDNAAAWESWLGDNLNHDGVRLTLRKKGTTLPGITYAEALDVALCHGWIDGQAGSIDSDFYFVAFSARRARSPWSEINQAHVARLIDEGRMRPSGLAQIDRAKADGRWDAAYRQKGAAVPDDLRAALDANPAAATMFDTLSAQNRWAILFRLGAIKGQETRVRRIEIYIAMLAGGETIYPQTTKGPKAEA